MLRWNTVVWVIFALALPLGGCRITATPAVRYQAATYGEPYVFYQSSTPYVYVGGTVYGYHEYYGQYYGPTYAVPVPPPYEGPISPPPPIIVGPAQDGQPAYREHGHGHH